MKIVPYTAQGYQSHFHYECMRKRFVAFVGGIQSGKTLSSAYQAWFEVIRNAEPKRGWIIGPTYQMSEVAEREFKNICPEAIRKSSVQRGRSVYEICNGHTVEIKTSEEPDRLRGDRIGWCWMDEAAMMSKETFDIILGRVLRYQGKIFCSTTPRGKNWVYDEFYRKSQPTDPAYDSDYACIRASSANNKYLSEKDVNRLRAKYSERYGQQELDAEFVSFEGMVYKEFDIGSHVVKPIDPGDGSFKRILSGVDFGVNDPFACIWMGLKDGRWYILDEYYLAGKTVDYHAPRILQNSWQPRVETCYADYHDVEGRMSLLRHGVRCIPSRDADIVIGVNEIGRMLVQKLPDGGPRLVVCSNCKNTIREFQSYKYPDVKSFAKVAGETIRQSGEKPAKGNEHAMDALRYVVMGDIGSYDYLGPAAVVESKPGPGTYGWLKEQWLRSARQSGQMGMGRTGGSTLEAPSWLVGAKK